MTKEEIDISGMKWFSTKWKRLRKLSFLSLAFRDGNRSDCSLAHRKREPSRTNPICESTVTLCLLEALISPIGRDKNWRFQSFCQIAPKEALDQSSPASFSTVPE